MNLRYYIAFILLITMVITIGFIIVKPREEKPIVRGEYYIACGCACCPWETPKEVCIYHSKNQSLYEIINQDINKSTSDECKYASCQKPIKYVYCD